MIYNLINSILFFMILYSLNLKGVRTVSYTREYCIFFSLIVYIIKYVNIRKGV